MSSAVSSGGIGEITLEGGEMPATTLASCFNWWGNTYCVDLAHLTNVYDPAEDFTFVESATSGLLMSDDISRAMPLDRPYIAGTHWQCKTKFKLTNHSVSHYEATAQNLYEPTYTSDPVGDAALGPILHWDQAASGGLAWGITWGDQNIAWGVDWADDGNPNRGVDAGRVYLGTSQAAFEATSDWQYLLVDVDEVTGTALAYVWNEGDPQPVSPTLTYTFTPGWCQQPPNGFTLSATHQGMFDWVIDFDYITMCASGDPALAPWPGYWYEETLCVTGPSVQLAAQFREDSISLWVNGIRQVPGVNFTTSSGYGSVSLNDTYWYESNSIKARYFVTGFLGVSPCPGGGGGS